jgi:hypothetical protein
MANLATKASPGVQLRVEKLLDGARHATGLSDFGDMWFMEPLKALVHFVNTEGGLPSEDVPPVKHLIDMLGDRLKLTDYLKRHPKVLDERLDVAGIILGQARGGSTLTQRLVGQSPQLTTTYFWEMFTPIPLPGETLGAPVERRKIGDEVVASWRRSMPEYAGIHPLDSNYYDEEIWLMDRGFNSYTYNIHFNIPGYHDWMLSQDHTRVYEDFKIWLKLLQYQSPSRKGKKWLLKNMHHPLTCNLPLMFKMFPGAKAIQTHRRMDEALTSLASVQSVHIRTSGSTSFDKAELGPRLIDQYLKATHHMMTVHTEMPAGTFIDIQYRDLVSDPVGQFRRMLEGMGLPVGPEDIKAASDWMAKNGRGTHPPHRYKPEDFGLSAEQLQQTFKFYHDKFLK